LVEWLAALSAVNDYRPKPTMNWLNQYIDHPVLLLVTTSFAGLVLGQYWKWVLGDIRSFGEEVTNAVLPDLYAFILGRYCKSEWAEPKIGFFALLLYFLELIGAVSHLFLNGKRPSHSFE
jgi:hypothetical protein